MVTTCALCRRELSTRSPGVYEKVTGWVSGQGAKGFRTKEHLGRYVHAACIAKEAAGVHREQQALAL